MSENITVIIHTYNEAEKIAACIESALLLTSNIVVIDMESQDNTVEIARKYNAEVYSFPFVYYVEPARGFGIHQAKTDWVMVVDADERITQPLAQEILNKIKKNHSSHYFILRKNIFGQKQWLKHGGWWPDSQIRLINKKFFQSWPKNIHSSPLIKGQSEVLTEPLLHYFHGDIKKMVDKTVIFEDIESELLFQAKKKSNTFIFFRKFLGELYRRLICKKGFQDGHIGIIESIYQAFSKTITYLYLYEKKNRRTL
jgi:glycosyltransferase involved in cell wall biosynthesis